MDVSDSKELSCVCVELGGEMELPVRSSGVGPADVPRDDEDRPKESTRDGNMLIAHALHGSNVRGTPTEKRSERLPVAGRHRNL